MKERLGSGSLTFEVVPHWEQRPSDFPLEDIAGVCTDRDDNVYLYARGEHPVIIYDRSGKFLGSWADSERFSIRSHGMHMAGDEIYLVDDGLGVVARYSLDGKRLGIIGPEGEQSDTGFQPGVHGVVRGAPPYNRPTNVSISVTGDYYVSDGYGNARVHRFDPDGTLIASWGEPGSGPSEFHIPHGICVHSDGRVFVADRQNDRVQIFGADGAYLTEWTDVRRPQDIYIHEDLVYVAELSWYPGEVSSRLGPVSEYLPARLSIFDLDGNLLTRWADPDPTKDGYFIAPHGIWLDSEGSIYLAEVTQIFAIDRGFAPKEAHRFQKFARC